jgi:nucleoside permease NupC
MTRSEPLAVVTGDMATIAGGVMAVYVSLLKNYILGVNKTYK